MIPIMINGKQLCEIFEPATDISGWTSDEIEKYSIDKAMYPTEVYLTSETYSRDAERTADYELEELIIVNRKAKPEFTWSMLKATYVQELFNFLGYTYSFKNEEDIIIPVDAPNISITYPDFIGTRTIDAYLGQTIEGTLVNYNGVAYWQDFRLSFPER